MVEVILTDEAAEWLDGLDDGEREAVARVINLLEHFGISLGFPYSSAIKTSKHGLRELRVKGRPLRALYVFDVTREAVVLCGFDKSGNERRFYETEVPRAERIWEQYKKEQGR